MNKADIILTNAIVLTMDEAFNLYEPGAVAVKDDSIIAVGPSEEINRGLHSHRNHRLLSSSADARSNQRAHTRTNDTAARVGRRFTPGCLAAGLYDAG